MKELFNLIKKKLFANSDNPRVNIPEPVNLEINFEGKSPQTYLIEQYFPDSSMDLKELKEDKIFIADKRLFAKVFHQYSDDMEDELNDEEYVAALKYQKLFAKIDNQYSAEKLALSSSLSSYNESLFFQPTDSEKTEGGPESIHSSLTLSSSSKIYGS